MKGERLTWGLLAGLVGVYLAGFLLGWSGRAPWHLLLVLVVIVGLYAIFSRRAQGR
jgi:hypothetical protein